MCLDMVGMKDQKISQKTKKGTTPSPTQEVDLKLGEGVAPTPSRSRGRFGGEKTFFWGANQKTGKLENVKRWRGGTSMHSCLDAAKLGERTVRWPAWYRSGGHGTPALKKTPKTHLCFVDIGLCLRTYMDVCVRAHWCGCGCGCVGPSTHPSRADQPFQAVFVGRKNRPENDFWQFFGSQTSCKMPFVVEFCQKKYIIWGILGHFGGWDFDKQFLDQLNSPFGQPSKPDPMNPGG